MGNTCSSSNPKVKAEGILGIYDIRKLYKGILSNQSGEISNQLINESIILFQSKLLKNSEDFYANLHLGVCLYKQGFYDVSESHLQVSLKSNETFTAYYVLGLIFTHKCKYHEALAYLDMSVKLNNSFLPGYLKAVEIHLKLNNLDQAKKVLKTAKNIEPDNNDLLILCGLYYKAKKSLEASCRYFEKALTGTSDPGKCYFYLGETKHLQGAFSDALGCYQQAIIHSKGNFIGIIKLSKALLYFDMEKFDVTLKFLKESLEYGLQMSVLLNSKGLGLFLKSPEILSSIQKFINSRFFDVIKTLKPMFRENRTNLLSGYFLALSYKALQNYTKSEHYFKKIIKYGHMQSLPLSVIIIKKAYIELEKLTALNQENENTFEFSESPKLAKITVPEFVINFHNFTTQTESTIKRSSSFIRKKTESPTVTQARSVTPPKSTISKLTANSKMMIQLKSIF
jgi:tetratricopeptide (TPR) repeat protein